MDIPVSTTAHFLTFGGGGSVKYKICLNVSVTASERWISFSNVVSLIAPSICVWSRRALPVLGTIALRSFVMLDSKAFMVQQITRIRWLLREICDFMNVDCALGLSPKNKARFFKRAQVVAIVSGVLSGCELG